MHKLLSATAVLAKTDTPPAMLARLDGRRGATLPLRGEIGAAEVALLVERALSLAKEGRPCVVVDLRAVTHLDYRSLSLLLPLLQRLRARGGDLRLAAPNCYLATILRFSGLDGVIAIYDSASAATRSFDGRAAVGGAA